MFDNAIWLLTLFIIIWSGGTNFYLLQDTPGTCACGMALLLRISLHRVLYSRLEVLFLMCHLLHVIACGRFTMTWILSLLCYVCCRREAMEVTTGKHGQFHIPALLEDACFSFYHMLRDCRGIYEWVSTMNQKVGVMLILNTVCVQDEKPDRALRRKTRLPSIAIWYARLFIRCLTLMEVLWLYYVLNHLLQIGVCTGVGRPIGSMAPAAYVLQKFSQQERAEVSPHLSIWGCS